MSPLKYPLSTPQVSDLIRSLNGKRTQQEILLGLRLKDQKHLRTQYVQLALAEDLIEMTSRIGPGSSKQKYPLTDKGHGLQHRWIQTQ